MLPLPEGEGWGEEQRPVQVPTTSLMLREFSPSFRTELSNRLAALVHEADEVIQVPLADSGQIDDFYGNRVEAGRSRPIHED